jgi:hypothetical protein
MIMAHPENSFRREDSSNQMDNLNCDLVEVTEMEVDNTVRPIRESLRQRAKLPPNPLLPPAPLRKEQSS